MNKCFQRLLLVALLLFAVGGEAFAQGRIATVAVKEFVFNQPVRVGDVLSFFAKIARVGRTSITVEVEVFAERLTQQGAYVKVTQAVLTYVAINEAGQPRPVHASL